MCHHKRMRIKTVHGRQIFDSRGNPTVEADIILEDGSWGRAAVPSGASTGEHEALELRDKQKEFAGLGVSQAVNNVNKDIAEVIVGLEADQSSIDEKLIKLDGTPNKSRLGANAILAVSLAVAKARAYGARRPLYEEIGILAENKDFKLPRPMINIINGGKHAQGSTDIQEFMIVPLLPRPFSECLRLGSEVFHSLGKVLSGKGYSTLLGDEGGYAPALKNGNNEALDLIIQAIERAGYKPGQDVQLAIDVAASEIYEDNKYNLKTESKSLNVEQMIAWYQELANKYPLMSIEDGLEQNDWAGWIQLTSRLGAKLTLVGDDLLVTNTEYIMRALQQKAANAVLIKPNQIGTLSETIAAVKLAKTAGWRTIISHRSGETEDTTIAHLAVGLNSGFIKTGSMSRGERTAKYNELLRIAEQLGL